MSESLNSSSNCPKSFGGAHCANAGKAILAKALTKSRKEDRHSFHDRLEFVVVQDHILESVCSHRKDEGGTAEQQCQVCRFEHLLGLPQLPEMIFPHNSLIILRKGPGTIQSPLIQFTAFDALQRVDKEHLPGVQVGPSLVWQSARHLEQPSGPPSSQHSFDWTFTSDYQGTLGDGVRVEKAPEGEGIDYERLKRRDPILFYEQATLYEDELADNGCAQMSIRVRVMPDTFLVLCRFYLRVDNVMVRVYDTRIYGTSENRSYALRESTQREAAYAQLSKEALAVILDPNLISTHLHLAFSQTQKIYYN